MKGELCDLRYFNVIPLESKWIPGTDEEILLKLAVFCICAGPDRPYVTVPGIVVAGMHQSVTISCSVQATAYVDNSELELKWKVVRRRHDANYYIL